MEVRTDSIWFYCDRHHSLLLKKERLTPITEASQTTTNTNHTAKPIGFATQYMVHSILYLQLGTWYCHQLRTGASHPQLPKNGER